MILEFIKNNITKPVGLIILFFLLIIAAELAKDEKFIDISKIKGFIKK